jgi:hypothetical protein
VVNLFKVHSLHYGIIMKPLLLLMQCTVTQKYNKTTLKKTSSHDQSCLLRCCLEDTHTTQNTVHFSHSPEK